VASHVAKLVLHLGPHFDGRGGLGGQRLYHSKERWWFPIRVGHLGTKFGKEGLTDVSQILAPSGKEMGLSYAGEIVSIYSAV